MILSMKNRASWFGPRTVWSAVALGVVACGGNSSTTVDSDGSGGAPLGGEKGSSGGRASADGGRAAGGRDGSGSSASDGGAGAGGGPEGDGGSTVGGSSSGGDSSGGVPGTGGAGGEDDHLDGLGDECETPGEFSCSAANELLALICGADKKWEVRETCESGEKCDFRAGSGVGLCQAPVEGCETNTSEPICGEQGVETCTRGGFETEVIEECEEGYGCEDAECVMVDDECPEGTVRECSGFAVCDGLEGTCGSETCAVGKLGMTLTSGPRTYRLPDGDLCGWGCDEEVEPGFAFTARSYEENPALRVRVGPGWRMRRIDVGNLLPAACVGEPAERCIVVPFDPVGGGDTGREAGVALYPLTDPPVIRNIIVDEVPRGTTCDD